MNFTSNRPARLRDARTLKASAAPWPRNVPTPPDWVERISEAPAVAGVDDIGPALRQSERLLREAHFAAGAVLNNAVEILKRAGMGTREISQILGLSRRQVRAELIMQPNWSQEPDRPDFVGVFIEAAWSLPPEQVQPMN